MNQTKFIGRNNAFVLLIVVFMASHCAVWLFVVVEGSTNPAGQETLIGIVGRDFVLLGADTSASAGGGGIALAASNVDKIHILRDQTRTKSGSGGFCLAVAPAGSSADVDRLVGLLEAHVIIREYDAGIGSDVECVFSGRRNGAPETMKAVLPNYGLTPTSLSHFARVEISSSLRTRTPYNVAMLVAGVEQSSTMFHQSPRHSTTETPRSSIDTQGGGDIHSQKLQGQVIAATKSFSSNSIGSATIQQQKKDIDEPRRSLTSVPCVPKLFWLDGMGSLHNVKYGCHGYGSNFLLSVLDKGYKPNMSREEALKLMNDCFDQLRTRYVINSGPYPPCIKCIDAIDGCTILSGGSFSN